LLDVSGIIIENEQQRRNTRRAAKEVGYERGRGGEVLSQGALAPPRFPNRVGDPFV
jgi:hypothetical protein